MKVKPIESFAIMAIGDMSGSQLVCKEEPVRKLEKENEIMRDALKRIKDNALDTNVLHCKNIAKEALSTIKGETE